MMKTDIRLCDIQNMVSIRKASIFYKYVMYFDYDALISLNIFNELRIPVYIINELKSDKTDIRIFYVRVRKKYYSKLCAAMQILKYRIELCGNTEYSSMVAKIIDSFDKNNNAR